MISFTARRYYSLRGRRTISCAKIIPTPRSFAYASRAHGCAPSPWDRSMGQNLMARTQLKLKGKSEQAHGGAGFVRSNTVVSNISQCVSSP
jgi:hypothetical protein